MGQLEKLRQSLNNIALKLDEIEPLGTGYTDEQIAQIEKLNKEFLKLEKKVALAEKSMIVNNQKIIRKRIFQRRK